MTPKEEKAIRNEVESELSHLSPEGREAVIRSRIGLLHRRKHPPVLIKADLGPNAGKTSKLRP